MSVPLRSLSEKRELSIWNNEKRKQPKWNNENLTANGNVKQLFFIVLGPRRHRSICD